MWDLVKEAMHLQEQLIQSEIEYKRMLMTRKVDISQKNQFLPEEEEVQIRCQDQKIQICKSWSMEEMKREIEDKTGKVINLCGMTKIANLLHIQLKKKSQQLENIDSLDYMRQKESQVKIKQINIWDNAESKQMVQKKLQTKIKNKQETKVKQQQYQMKKGKQNLKKSAYKQIYKNKQVKK